MYKADVWIWTDSRYAKESPKCFHYSVEMLFKGAKHCRYGGIDDPVTATWNGVTLRAIAEALERFTNNAEVTIHSDNRWVLNMIKVNLDTWEKAEFMTAKKQEIKNAAEWRRIAKRSHSLKLLTDPIGFDRSPELAEHAFAEERMEYESRRRNSADNSVHDDSNHGAGVSG